MRLQHMGCPRDTVRWVFALQLLAVVEIGVRALPSLHLPVVPETHISVASNVTLNTSITDPDFPETPPVAYQIEFEYAADGGGTGDNGKGLPCFFLNTSAVASVAFPDVVFHLGGPYVCATVLLFTGPLNQTNTVLQTVVLDTNTVSGTVTITLWKDALDSTSETLTILSDTFAPTASPTMTPTPAPTPDPTPEPTPGPPRQIAGYTVWGFTVLCVIGGLMVFACFATVMMFRANETRMVLRSGGAVWRG
jgi:hypothetical protein